MEGWIDRGKLPGTAPNFSTSPEYYRNYYITQAQKTSDGNILVSGTDNRGASS